MPAITSTGRLTTGTQKEGELTNPDLTPTTGTAGAGARSQLSELGLAPGELVRWRDRPGGRWRQGTVVGRERDGSVGVRDAKGASRAFTLERLEVRSRGPRGALAWEAAAERAARTEQLALWGDPPEATRPRR